MRSLLAAAIALVISAPAWAYYGVLDNGEIMARGKYKLTGDLQAITDSGGINAAARFDTGFQDEFGMRGLIGFGVTDFFLGGFFKWMPIPDVAGQPAIGFNAGAVFATNDGARDLTFRLEPLISKRFASESGVFTPYLSLPLGLRSRNAENRDNLSDVTWQLVVGSQLQLEQWKNLQFMAEVGVDLNHALSHVSLAAVLYFDEEKGFTLE